MATKKKSTSIRQEQIAQAALRIIACEGVGALSIAGIAEQIGIVPSAIYRHYRGKEQVLDAVVALVRTQLLDNVRVATSEASNPLDALCRLVKRQGKLIEKNQGIPRIVFSEEVYAGNPERKGKLYRLIREYLGRIETIVADGQLSGAIRNDLAPATIALMVLGLVQPSAILWHLSGGDFNISDHLESNCALMAALLQVPAAGNG